jgi:hypothetical protein
MWTSEIIALLNCYQIQDLRKSSEIQKPIAKFGTQTIESTSLESWFGDINQVSAARGNLDTRQLGQGIDKAWDSSAKCFRVVSWAQKEADELTPQFLERV